jgi:FHA domain
VTICKVCGKENKADYTFCLGCGAELKGVGTPVSTSRAESSRGGVPVGSPGLGNPLAGGGPGGAPLGAGPGGPLGGAAPNVGLGGGMGGSSGAGHAAPVAPLAGGGGAAGFPLGAPGSGAAPGVGLGASMPLGGIRAPTPPIGTAAAGAPFAAQARERSLSSGWNIPDSSPAALGALGMKAPVPPDPDAGPTKVGGLSGGMGARSTPVAPAPSPVPLHRPTPAAIPAVVRSPVPLARPPVAMPLGGGHGSSSGNSAGPSVGASSSIDVRDTVPDAPVDVSAPGTRACPNCSASVPAEFAFCGSCGSRVAPALNPPLREAPAPAVVIPAAAPAAVGRARGKIILIRPDGSEGASLTLNDGENVIGRAMGPLFENDGYLSPRHAEIVINAAGCVVRDLKSLNGVYFKMTHEEPLESADIFRLGQELLRFDLVPPAAALDDGTEIMGSPNLGYWGRISLVIGREIDGNAWPVGGDGVTLGRERGDINFPDDGYVSGLHARLAFASGRVTLTDLHSSNGTFMRIRSQRVLENGALVQFGQQLFRLHLG